MRKTSCGRVTLIFKVGFSGTYECVYVTYAQPRKYVQYAHTHLIVFILLSKCQLSRRKCVFNPMTRNQIPDSEVPLIPLDPQ